MEWEEFVIHCSQTTLLQTCSCPQPLFPQWESDVSDPLHFTLLSQVMEPGGGEVPDDATAPENPS